MTALRFCRSMLLASATGAGVVAAIACSNGDPPPPPVPQSSGGTAGSAGASGTSGAAGSSGAGAGGMGGAAGLAGTGASGGTAGSSGIAGASGAGTGGQSSSGNAGTSGTSGMAGAPVSTLCGDGLRDPATEECDDGNTDNTDSCTSKCGVNDLVALPSPASDGGPPPAGRAVGTGRHPIAADADGIVAAFIRNDTYAVDVAPFGAKGTRGTPLVSMAMSAPDLATSNPVVTSLGNGAFALVTTESQIDGDELGIAVRIFDKTGKLGTPLVANGTTDFSQHDADAVFANGQLLVAWVDESDASTAPDLRFRAFSPSGTPLSGEQTLAATTDVEGDVVLTSFGSSFAAAWRSAADGTESIVVQAGAASWSVGPYSAPAVPDKPDLAALDATHLLLLYTEGEDPLDAGMTTGGKLRYAILSTSATGSVQASDVALPSLAMFGIAERGQADPALVLVGSRLYASFTTPGAPGDPAGSDVWLKELVWTGGAIDDSKPELALPRSSADMVGDQQRPRLAPTPLGPEGAIAAIWEDSGETHALTEAPADVLFELIPTPVLRPPPMPGGS